MFMAFQLYGKAINDGNIDFRGGLYIAIFSRIKDINEHRISLCVNIINYVK